jgi:hypothetical protein
VAGEHEVFEGSSLGETTPGLPINVFYVSRSLLLENSTYFNILLDCAPDRVVVFLPEDDHKIVSDWLDLIYQADRVPRRCVPPLPVDSVQKYLAFAKLVGSEKLRNVIVDNWQAAIANKTVWNLADLQKDDSSESPCFDLVLEYQAYIAVTEGWAGFMQHCQLEQGKNWLSFMSTPENANVTEALLIKIDELHQDKNRGGLADPRTPNSCKWHEHASAESQAECARIRGERNTSDNTTGPQATLPIREVLNGDNGFTTGSGEI